MKTRIASIITIMVAILSGAILMSDSDQERIIGEVETAIARPTTTLSPFPTQLQFITPIDPRLTPQTKTPTELFLTATAAPTRTTIPLPSPTILIPPTPTQERFWNFLVLQGVAVYTCPGDEFTTACTRQTRIIGAGNVLQIDACTQRPDYIRVRWERDNLWVAYRASSLVVLNQRYLSPQGFTDAEFVEWCRQ